jgi:hypothetical protein
VITAGRRWLILFHKKLLLSQGKMPDDLSISITEKPRIYKTTFLTIP